MTTRQKTVFALGALAAVAAGWTYGPVAVLAVAVAAALAVMVA